MARPSTLVRPFHVIREGVILEFQQEPEGGYTVTVPALPGCLTYGETFEEALTMIDDAISDPVRAPDGWHIVKLLGMVNCAPGFNQTPRVINGCSDLLVEVLGPCGKHARSAVGVAELPRNAAVEIEFVVAYAA